MALETGNYVANLVATNPTATDPKSQGDDHLRLLKAVLLNTFAGFPGLVVVTGTEAQGATANDYVVTVAPAPAAYTAGFFVAFKAAHANTGAATVQVNSLGTKALKDVGGADLAAGVIQSGAVCVAFYDGTDFFLISANAALNSPALVGTPTAPTPPITDNSTRVCTTAFAVQLAFQAALPGVAGHAGQVLATDGTNSAWTSGGTTGQFLQNTGSSIPVWATVVPPNIQRIARTSDTPLSVSENRRLIDITSGTFTQTFDACASLGDGWFCYMRNSGSGDVTLDPNGSETIDGLSSFVMYPGEVRLVQCDGTELRSIVLNAFYKTFEASGTFAKPPGYMAFHGLLWGGGGGGGSTIGTTSASGGGGGACLPVSFKSSDVPSSVTVTIGAGGAVETAGGNSVFNAATAYGGGPGTNSSVGASTGGGGGGVLSAGVLGAPGAPAYLTGSSVGKDNHGFGGGYPDSGAQPGRSVYGGGAGGSCSGGFAGNIGGRSIYGGGGGGGAGGALGGQSVFGGAGGTGSIGGTAAIAPGGGGGARGGAGARGELRIWGVI